jgi:eukaryotic-like serine/threonine-protein kinase
VELAPGTILLGKYRIDELIGTGGMGNVVRASHLYLHQPVAIKVLLPEMVASESTRQRFLREAQATVRLKSEHSARVIDVGTTPEGVPFMVMEFLHGNDLNQILRHHGPQQPAIVVDLMLQACEGIAEAHALGIVHRDIKPSNFFITQRPDGSMLLKILDFGISKTPVGYDELTGTQTVIGTPSYMAPEQMKSGRAADPRSDLWSIGVVMYQLITGRPPFSGESYAELVLKVGLEPPAPISVPLPAGLAEVILRCLEKDPAARFQNVGDLARMLAPYASDPVSASQSANRTARTLQQRGAQHAQHGMPSAQLGSGGSGLSTPIPISPAQLTPRGWPPSQGSSLSHSVGQVTLRTRSNRGFLIAGVLALCVVAGVGGYAISQMSKPDTRVRVQAPPPTVAPAAEPAGAPGEAAEPTPAPAAAVAEPAAPEAPADAKREDKPGDEPADKAAVKPAVAVPAIGKATTAKPAAAKPAAAKLPTDGPFTSPMSLVKPADAEPANKPAVTPAADKPAVVKPAKPADRKSSTRSGSRSTSKPDKPAEKPAEKPTKPRKADDLFDTRH